MLLIRIMCIMHGVARVVPAQRPLRRPLMETNHMDRINVSRAHRRGRWVLGGDGVVRTEGDAGGYVADVTRTVGIPMTVAERATGTLIAKAPALLDALEHVTDSYRAYRLAEGDDGTSYSIEAAACVIRQATGQDTPS